jgi:hypothetical protein
MKKNIYTYVLLVGFIFLSLFFTSKAVAYSIDELEDMKTTHKKNAELIYENIAKTDDPSDEDIEKLKYINNQLILINERINFLNQVKQEEINKQNIQNNNIKQNDIQQQLLEDYNKKIKERNESFNKFVYLCLFLIFLFFLFKIFKYFFNLNRNNNNVARVNTNLNLNHNNRRPSNIRIVREIPRTVIPNNQSNQNNNRRYVVNRTIPSNIRIVREIPRTVIPNNQSNQNNRNTGVHQRHNTITDSNGARRDNTFVSSGTDGRVPLDLT